MARRCLVVKVHHQLIIFCTGQTVGHRRRFLDGICTVATCMGPNELLISCQVTPGSCYLLLATHLALAWHSNGTLPFNCVQADAATTTKRPLRVMIAGAPAAGKGTQCEKIVEKVSAEPAKRRRRCSDSCCRCRPTLYNLLTCMQSAVSQPSSGYTLAVCM